MKRSISLFIASVIVLFFFNARSEGLDYYFQGVTFDSNIPTPEEFLGYQSGSRITEHSRINAYYEKISELSDRTKLIEIGRSHENRPIYVLAVSAPDNIVELNELKEKRKVVRKGERADTPLVIFLGNTVHGNEISASEAALYAAYYYVASNDDKVIKQLKESVIFIDPVRNPDGQERFASWVNSNISFNRNNISQYDREHTEGWPRGRGNHYWFDLNRDWINVVHPESKARVAFYQKWLPHVQADHHEMGVNSTFFFEPTDPDGNESHLVPKANYELNRRFAEYFADALNGIGSFYYTKESFDNKNPNFGSTYPDFNGGVGILFEQGSSRGLVQESENGLVTLPFTIRNQLVTTIATVDAAHGNREALFDLQDEFFNKAAPGIDTRSSYIIGDKYDITRLHKFIDLLLIHNLDVYENNREIEIDSVTYYPGKSYIVPAGQPNSALAGIIFDDKTDFEDASKLGYGAGFSIVYSTGLSYGITNSANSGSKVEVSPVLQVDTLQQSDYAYLIDFRDSGSQKLLLHLLENDILVKVATKPFTVQGRQGELEFSYGSLLIPVSNQTVNSTDLYNILSKLSVEDEVNIVAVSSGFNLRGADLGSSSFKRVEKPKVLIVTGADISSTEAGEVWHLFDQHLRYPLTRVNSENLRRVPLNEFNRIVFVSGSYDFLSKDRQDDLKNWIRNGGTLITVNGASRWAINSQLSPDELVELPDSVVQLPRDRQPTSIFQTNIDLSHPLAFGLTSERLPVLRESYLFIKSGNNTVSEYPDQPLLNGYISPERLEQMRGSASVTASNYGRGHIILFTENPIFRGIWDGTSRTFVNAILFSNITSDR